MGGLWLIMWYWVNSNNISLYFNGNFYKSVPIIIISRYESCYLELQSKFLNSQDSLIEKKKKRAHNDSNDGSPHAFNFITDRNQDEAGKNQQGHSGEKIYW